MRTERKLLKGALLALCAAHLMLCIVLAAGWSKPKKPMPHCRRYGKTPEAGDNSLRRPAITAALPCDLPISTLKSTQCA